LYTKPVYGHFGPKTTSDPKHFGTVFGAKVSHIFALVSKCTGHVGNSETMNIVTAAAT